MADEVLDGPDMIGQLFGEGQGIPHQPGDALPQGVIETLDMIGFAGVLRNGFVLRSGNHACVDSIVIRIERRPLAVHHRKIGPQLLCTLMTAITAVERND